MVESLAPTSTREIAPPDVGCNPWPHLGTAMARQVAGGSAFCIHRPVKPEKNKARCLFDSGL